MKSSSKNYWALLLLLSLSACQQQKYTEGPFAHQAEQRHNYQAVKQIEADAALTQLADEQASKLLKMIPEVASQMGVGSDIAGAHFSSKLASYTAPSNQAVMALNQEMITSLQAIKRQDLSASAKVTYDVLLNAYQMANRYNQHQIGLPSVIGLNSPYIINQLFGPHMELPRLLISQQPVNNFKQAEAFLARLAAVPRVIDELIVASEQDAARGIVPPAFILTAVQQAIGQIIAPAWSEHPVKLAFSKQFEAIEGLNDAYQQDVEQRLEQAMTQGLYPAYQRLAAHITELQGQADDRAGVWKLPNGEAVYQTTLDAYGASGMSADEIHQLGLQETERIHKEMEQILRDMNYVDGSIAARLQALAADPEMLYDNTAEVRAEIMTGLQQQVNDFMAVAPKWFKTIPSQPIEVRLIPAYEGGSAYYTPPSLDGALPGIFWINLNDTADWPKYTLKTLAYHEAVPGHHFQASLQLEVDNMPLLRNMLFYSEFGEGWALYGEQLVHEVGLYDGDPLGNLGRLRAEVYRAARLVVDTGIHHRRWTREQAIEWMMAATGERRAPIAREIDRYVVWPGQATSYKLGMIHIQRLRAQAEQVLAERFDLRTFHDMLLLEGTMPLPVLTQRVSEWLDQQRLN